MNDFSMCTNASCFLRESCRRHKASGTIPSDHQSYVNFAWFWDNGKPNCIHYFEIEKPKEPLKITNKKEWDWEIPLLEALRGYGAGDVKELPATVTVELIAHAADEIERLKREAKIRIDQIEREQEAHLKTMADLNKAADEIERLRDTRIEFIDMINNLIDERVNLRKDIQRLRKALTIILNDVGYRNPMRMTTEISDKVLFEAKEALNDQADV